MAFIFVLWSLSGTLETKSNYAVSNPLLLVNNYFVTATVVLPLNIIQDRVHIFYIIITDV